MHQISALTRWIGQTWDSLQAVSTFELILKWVVAISGVLILLVSWRERVLSAREHAKQIGEIRQHTERELETLQEQIKNQRNIFGSG